MNPELDLDENDNGEEADLDDRMDHIAAVDMGLTAHRDDHRDDLANRTNRTRANDPARRSGPPPSVPRNPIEPDHGRGGGGAGIRAPNAVNYPPHLQGMVMNAQPQAPRRRPSQIRPEVDARERDVPPASTSRPRAPGSPASPRAARTSVSSTSSRASRASTTIETNGEVDTGTGTGSIADSLGALLMQEEADEGEGELPCYPSAEEDARRILDEADAGSQRPPPDTQPDSNDNHGQASPPAYPAELLPFINDTDEKRPPPT